MVNKRKKLIIISMAVLILTVAVFTATVNYISSMEEVNVKQILGNNQIISANITYMNIEEGFESSFTVNCSQQGIIKKEKSDVRVTTGFCDTQKLDEYIVKQGYSNNFEFLQEKGYVWLYYYFKGKNYYLLQNTVTKPYCWNLLISQNDTHKLIKLSDINLEQSNTEYPEISFAKKVEYINGKVRFYLDNGIYIIDENENIEYIPINLNEIFYKITKD